VTGSQQATGGCAGSLSCASFWAYQLSTASGAMKPTVPRGAQSWMSARHQTKVRVA